MDFATISSLLQESGYTKIGTKSVLIDYDTQYLRGMDMVSVQWKLGGYVQSVTVRDGTGKINNFDSAHSFLNSFSEN